MSLLWSSYWQVTCIPTLEKQEESLGKQCCLNALLWFVLMESTCNFNLGSFRGVMKSSLYLLYKRYFRRKGFSKQGKEGLVWSMHHIFSQECVLGCGSKEVSFLGGEPITVLPPLDCLPCLCQTQICWSTYSEVPWQGLLHHLNSERVFVPNSMSMIDHSLKT